MAKNGNGTDHAERAGDDPGQDEERHQEIGGDPRVYHEYEPVDPAKLPSSTGLMSFPTPGGDGGPSTDLFCDGSHHLSALIGESASAGSEDIGTMPAKATREQICSQPFKGWAALGLVMQQINSGQEPPSDFDDNLAGGLSESTVSYFEHAHRLGTLSDRLLRATDVRHRNILFMLRHTPSSTDDFYYLLLHQMNNFARALHTLNCKHRAFLASVCCPVEELTQSAVYAFFGGPTESNTIFETPLASWWRHKVEDRTGWASFPARDKWHDVLFGVKETIAIALMYNPDSVSVGAGDCLARVILRYVGEHEWSVLGRGTHLLDLIMLADSYRQNQYGSTFAGRAVTMQARKSAHEAPPSRLDNAYPVYHWVTNAAIDVPPGAQRVEERDADSKLDSGTACGLIAEKLGEDTYLSRHLQAILEDPETFRDAYRVLSCKNLGELVEVLTELHIRNCVVKETTPEARQREFQEQVQFLRTHGRSRDFFTRVVPVDESAEGDSKTDRAKAETSPAAERANRRIVNDWPNIMVRIKRRLCQELGLQLMPWQALGNAASTSGQAPNGDHMDDQGGDAIGQVTVDPVTGDRRVAV